MNGLKLLIQVHLDRYQYFDDLFTPIELLEKERITPGIKLDCCKSILEGVLKTMLSKLDLSLSPSQLGKYSSKDAALKLFKMISRQNNDFDEEFIESIIITVQNLSNSRNSKGDLSHGHVAPKENASDEFADMIVQYTEATSIYLLKHFYSLDLVYKEPDKYDSENKIEFNEYLDSIHEPIGQTSYSRALYQLDYDAYIDEQDRFNVGIM